MPTPLASQIQDVLPRIEDAYYKLVLAVGPARTGKTATLIELAARHSWPRLNVNLRLSERLLDLTHRQRATRVASIPRCCSTSRRRVSLETNSVRIAGSCSLKACSARRFSSRSRSVCSSLALRSANTASTSDEAASPAVASCSRSDARASSSSCATVSASRSTVSPARSLCRRSFAAVRFSSFRSASRCATFVRSISTRVWSIEVRAS